MRAWIISAKRLSPAHTRFCTNTKPDNRAKALDSDGNRRLTERMHRLQTGQRGPHNMALGMFHYSHTLLYMLSGHAAWTLQPCWASRPQAWPMEELQDGLKFLPKLDFFLYDTESCYVARLASNPWPSCLSQPSAPCLAKWNLLLPHVILRLWLWLNNWGEQLQRMGNLFRVMVSEVSVFGSVTLDLWQGIKVGSLSWETFLPTVVRQQKEQRAIVPLSLEGTLQWPNFLPLALTSRRFHYLRWVTGW